MEIISDCQAFCEEECIEDTYKELNSNKQEGNKCLKFIFFFIELNKTLVQAKILDRTFISKGSIIDVFHTDTNDWD